MTRSPREGGWRSGKGRQQVSNEVKARDGNNIVAVSAGRDAYANQNASRNDPAVAEVRASLREFRDALYRLDADDNRDAGLRAADRIERALGNPAEQRDTIEGAADTIGVMGRAVTVLAGAAVAVQQAVAALF
ncbi:hypothetical protein [Streptomyces griseorubiginosus]|uniref:hypothetical protein n=1 Tax=Streptomyces griseorubiginosus TaxID=67304 RepID=UPI003669BA57